MMTHGQEFASDMRKREQQRALWTSQWPFYCTWCEGYGTNQGQDGMTQPCQCVLKKQCPRCGAADALYVISDPHILGGEVVISNCTQCHWDQTQGGLPT